MELLFWVCTIVPLIFIILGGIAAIGTEYTGPIWVLALAGLLIGKLFEWELE